MAYALILIKRGIFMTANNLEKIENLSELVIGWPYAPKIGLKRGFFIAAQSDDEEDFEDDDFDDDFDDDDFDDDDFDDDDFDDDDFDDEDDEA